MIWPLEDDSKTEIVVDSVGKLVVRVSEVEVVLVVDVEVVVDVTDEVAEDEDDEEVRVGLSSRSLRIVHPDKTMVLPQS